MSLTVIRPTQRPGLVDHDQLLDPVLVQQAARLVLADALADRDHLAGHQLGHRLARIVGEAHVAVGEDADEPAPACRRRRARPPECRRSTARRISASASASVASGKMVIGSTTMPLSKRLTLRTSSAWSLGRRGCGG